MTINSVFGSNPIKQSCPQYEQLTIAAQTSLNWPLETAATPPYVAAQMDITPTVVDVLLLMPPANNGSTGIAAIITNVGAVEFQLGDANATLITTIGVGQSWIISLIDNSSIGGVWRAYQLGATTSNANAGQLADNKTIQATGTKLQVFMPGEEFTANTTLGEGQRGQLNVWAGAAPGTFAIDAMANLTPGWFCFVNNEGGGALTLQPADLPIDGQANVVLQPGSGVIIEYDGVEIHAVGGLQVPVSIANGGTGANNPEQALVNLGGSTIGISIFEAASASAILTLLGLGGTLAPFTEATINANQTLNANSTQSAYVATGALSLNLPLTTGLTTKFIFLVYAEGGIVTLVPNASDAINGGTAGSNLQLAQGVSALIMTDANGNWWPFFLSGGSAGVTSVALTAPPEFVVTGSPGSGVVALALAKANQAPNTFYAGPASGSAGQPLFRAITLADIASILPGSTVLSVFGRGGAVSAQTGDYTVGQVTGAAPLASPSFTGNPQTPTPATADNSQAIASTAFVKAQGYATTAFTNATYPTITFANATYATYTYVNSTFLTGAPAYAGVFSYTGMFSGPCTPPSGGAAWEASRPASGATGISIQVPGVWRNMGTLSDNGSGTTCDLANRIA